MILRCGRLFLFFSLSHSDAIESACVRSPRAKGTRFLSFRLLERRVAVDAPRPENEEETESATQSTGAFAPESSIRSRRPRRGTNDECPFSLAAAAAALFFFLLAFGNEPPKAGRRALDLDSACRDRR